MVPKNFQQPMSHIEAYPRLNVREARKQLLSGRGEVCWRNARGEFVGMGRIQINDANSLVVDYQFRDVGHIASCQATASFECSIRKMDYSQEDFLALCPRCSTRVRTLLLFDCAWTCYHCQPLAHRSKMVGDLVRKSERLAELERLSAAGRPKGMHNRTYLKVRDERFLLKQELEGHRGMAREIYEEVITSCWSSEGLVIVGRENAGPGGDLAAGSDEIDGADDEQGERDDDGEDRLLAFAGQSLFAGSPLAITLDDQLLRFARLELAAMAAEGRKPTRIRLRKRLARKPFDLPPALRRDDGIRIVGRADDQLLCAHHGMSFSGNADYFLVAPDSSASRHPVAVIGADKLMLKTRFKREELRFIPVIIEQECELIERRMDVLRRGVEAYNCTMRVQVRRVIERHWDALVGSSRDDVARGRSAPTTPAIG
jgi:hypothetical protein